MPTILTIPSSDVYTIRGVDGKFFKIYYNGGWHQDINVRIDMNYRTTLEHLAKEMGVTNIGKIKKKELIDIVEAHLRFEQPAAEPQPPPQPGSAAERRAARRARLAAAEQSVAEQSVAEQSVAEQSSGSFE